jgi:hypothetical protein
MQDADGSFWTTDRDVFLELAGASEILEWFGFVPSFHDATMNGLEIANGSAALSLNVFRMTDQVNAQGYFILDRHALITLHLDGVTGVSLKGDASSTVFELGIRPVGTTAITWETVAGPRPGDWEVRWESAYGLEGALYARDVKLTLQDAASP